MSGNDDELHGIDEDLNGVKGLIQPAFEVGPPGVGPVTGIDGGDFFQPPQPDGPTAEPATERQSEGE